MLHTTSAHILERVTQAEADTRTVKANYFNPLSSLSVSLSVSLSLNLSGKICKNEIMVDVGEPTNRAHAACVMVLAQSRNPKDVYFFDILASFEINCVLVFPELARLLQGLSLCLY